jgi:hypothetical protein
MNEGAGFFIDWDRTTAIWVRYTFYKNYKKVALLLGGIHSSL